MMFVLGGARSGKSSFALKVAQEKNQPLVMIATAEALDEEMSARIQRHREERDTRWRTIESPLNLVGALSSVREGDCVVIDCLTLWLSNLMHAGMDVLEASEQLLNALEPHDSILIANEVGLGIVPDNTLARHFRDEAGRMNQKIAEAADTVVLVVAGLPLYLKGQAHFDSRS